MASGSARTSSNGSAGRHWTPLFTSSRGLCMLVVLESPDNPHALSLAVGVLTCSVALY